MSLATPAPAPATTGGRWRARSGITATNRAVLVLLHLAVGAVLIPALQRTAPSRTGRPA
jgi:hypothetical protein